MNDEEYLKLFGKPQTQENDNLNETDQNTWENLNKPQQNQWENLNETPDLSQYQTNENLNDGWGNLDIQVETRVNGVPQQGHQLSPNSRRHKNKGNNLNGLDSFLEDEDLREVVKQSTPMEGPTEMMAPPVVESIKDAEIVTIDMFENMNSNALLTLANGKIAHIDASKVTNNVSDTKVTFIKS